MFGQDIGIEISGRGWGFDTSYSHRFDLPAPRPSRAVWSMGWRWKTKVWSLLLQIYRPGTQLDWHTDGHNIANQIWGVVLWKSKVGGDLEVEGLVRRWWRFHQFDGGLYKHRVTPCEGYRVVLMFQYGKPLP